MQKACIEGHLYTAASKMKERTALLKELQFYSDVPSSSTSISVQKHQTLCNSTPAVDCVLPCQLS